jgi:hypothetical protein
VGRQAQPVVPAAERSAQRATLKTVLLEVTQSNSRTSRRPTLYQANQALVHVMLSERVAAGSNEILANGAIRPMFWE